MIMEKLLDVLLVDEDVVELDDNDDLWWVLGGRGWVLAGANDYKSLKRDGLPLLCHVG